MRRWVMRFTISKDAAADSTQQKAQDTFQTAVKYLRDDLGFTVEEQSLGKESDHELD